MSTRASNTELYIFAISHYCEKARWALDWMNLEYDLKYLSPGPHVEATQKMGASASSLPLLIEGEQVIQGSSAIIDWGESSSEGALGPAFQNEAEKEEARLIEKRLDDRLGVHIRRYYYSEAMLDYPETVLPIFQEGLGTDDTATLASMWPFVRERMIESMDLGPAQREESRRIILEELDWVEAELSDGRPFFRGEQFSRIDLTAASLLAALARPSEHPTYDDLGMPPKATIDLAEWRDRPSMRWVRGLYRAHR